MPVTSIQPVGDIKTGPYFGVRHLQATFLFFYLIIMFINRLNVSVAIVAMTNAANSNPAFPEYKWNEAQKSYILSSMYWGNIFVQIPAGYCTRKYGVKLNLLICTLCTGILSLLVPFCLPWGGWEIYCSLRFAQGISQGCLMPCLMQHLAKWSPPAELNRLGGFVHTGFTIGTVAAFALSGLIAHSSLGWPGIFYVSAALCFIWCAFWLIYGADDVSRSWLIGSEERDYIESALQEKFGSLKAKIPIPWRAIFRSPPFYALLVARSAQNWSFFTILSELPLYFNAVLGLPIRQNALYSALPHLTYWLLSYLYIFLADYIIHRELLTLTGMRKLINSIAVVIPTGGLIWFGFLEATQSQFAIVLISLIIGINSGTMIGTRLGTIDLSPNHAGMLSSVINTCANVALLLAPLFVGLVMDDEQNRVQWQFVFIVTALVMLAGGVFFLIFGSAEQQPWNEPDFLQGKTEEKPWTFKYIENSDEQLPAVVVQNKENEDNV